MAAAGAGLGGKAGFKQNSGVLSGNDKAVSFFSGAVAGAVSKTFTAPFSRMTILLQTKDMHSAAGGASSAVSAPGPAPHAQPTLQHAVAGVSTSTSSSST